MVDIEKNESDIFDEVYSKISKFVKGIKGEIFRESFNKREYNSSDYEVDELNKYLDLLRTYIDSRFSNYDTERGEIFDKYRNDFHKRIKELTDKYNKASELAKLKVTFDQGMAELKEIEKEMHALLNEMKTYYNELVDQFGIKYEYVGDGTKEKRGDIILKNGAVFGQEEISYKGITYSSSGKIGMLLPDEKELFLVYNSEEQIIEYKRNNEYSKPVLCFKVEIKDGEFFIDTVITSLTKWLKDNDYYKEYDTEQYKEIENSLNNLLNFKEMLKSEFVAYRLITENAELKRKNEQIEPLQSEIEIKKNENEQLNAEVIKKDGEITKVNEESAGKDEEIRELRTKVDDLEKNQQFIFSTLKELASQVDYVSSKKIVLSTDLKRLQGYKDGAMASVGLQNVEENGESKKV